MQAQSTGESSSYTTYTIRILLLSVFIYVHLTFSLGFVCEFGGEGKGRLWGVENMRKNGEIFQKN